MKNYFLKNNKSKQFEHQLKESELRYRRLFESAKDGILILDFESGNIVDANPFIVKLIDYPLNEILGRKLWEIGLFADKQESELAFIELKINGYIRYEDKPIKRRNGKTTEVEFISNVYLANNVKVIQCNIRDITERKQAEKKQKLTTSILSILSSQENWEELIINILDEIKRYTGVENVLIHLTENEEHSHYNEGKLSDYQYDAKKYLYQKDQEAGLKFKLNEKSYINCMCNVVISGKTDASLPYFSIGGSFYSDNSYDIYTAIDKLENPIEVLNLSGSIDDNSVALIPLYSGNDIIGILQLSDKRPDMFSIDTIHYLESIGKTIAIAFKRIKNENKIRNNEQFLKKQNLDYVSLNKEYSKLNKELSESIKHIKNINSELIGAKSKAEESDRLKSAFLANMSHEIRTPMNAILGFSSFLLKPDLPREKVVRFVEIINTSSLQLMSIISDIIDISKIESGQLSINAQSVNIKNLLDQIYVSYSKGSKLQQVDLNFSINCPEDTVQIITDGNKIRQVICNLLDNAIKFTKKGKIEFGYTVLPRHETSILQFFVKDTGMGIAPENKAVIFERFRQVESDDKQIYGGNGLGLSISKALVEKLGGNISVDSIIGKGSTFYFTIPFNKSNNTPRPEKPTIKLQRHVDWAEKTILIAVDEAFNYAYLKEVLLITKVKLIHAWNGKEAFEQICQLNNISLVLMDIKMPVMDGYESLKLIKQFKPGLPVIAQTSHALSQDRNLALKAGFDDYISKPISAESLVEIVSTYLSSN